MTRQSFFSLVTRENQNSFSVCFAPNSGLDIHSLFATNFIYKLFYKSSVSQFISCMLVSTSLSCLENLLTSFCISATLKVVTVLISVCVSLTFETLPAEIKVLNISIVVSKTFLLVISEDIVSPFFVFVSSFVIFICVIKYSYLFVSS